LLVPLAIYAVVSLAFLLIENLNPDGFNAIHWLNMSRAASSPIQMLRVVLPFENNVLTDDGVYSLPVILGRHFGAAGVWSGLTKLPLVVIAAMSLLPLAARQRRQRLRLAVVAAAACVPCHFLSYYPVQEYHYTILLLLSPVLLWLWRSEAGGRLRVPLAVAFVSTLACFLPTGNFLAPTVPGKFWTVSALERVVPAMVTFCGLATYGFALAWQQYRLVSPKKGQSRWRSLAREVAVEGWRAVPVAGAAALTVVALAAAVYATAPWRVLAPVATWTARDRLQQSRMVESCSTRALNVNPDNAQAHYALGTVLIDLGQIEEGLAHCYRSVDLDPTFDGCANLGLKLLNLGRLDEAVVQFRRSTALDPGIAATQNNLGVGLGRQGRFFEAIEHYREALKLDPNFPEAKSNLAWILATCPHAVLRNGKEAIELAGQVCRSSNDHKAKPLDVLAAGYAELGRFAEALPIARRALAAARQSNQKALAAEIQARIDLYSAGKPFRIGGAARP
jgi:tetratricopeptide (TPR) repeat protein